MKGLILKDIYVIKDGLLIPVLMLALLGVVLSTLSSPWVLIVVAACSLSMQANMTIPTDKSSQWYKFSVTLPISRVQFIRSKYVMYVILGALGLLFGGAITVAVTMNMGIFKVGTLLKFVCMAISMVLLPGSVNVPLTFLLNEEQSVVGIVISYVAAAGLFMGITFVLGHFINMSENTLLTYGLVAGISVIVYLVSWAFAPKVVSRRDL